MYYIVHVYTNNNAIDTIKRWKILHFRVIRGGDKWMMRTTGIHIDVIYITVKHFPPLLRLFYFLVECNFGEIYVISFSYWACMRYRTIFEIQIQIEYYQLIGWMHFGCPYRFFCVWNHSFRFEKINKAHSGTKCMHIKHTFMEVLLFWKVFAGSKRQFQRCT